MTLFCPGLPEETETVVDRFCLKYNLNLVKSEANPKKIGKTIKPDLILLAPGKERKIRKLIRLYGKEKTFVLPAEGKMSVKESDRLIKAALLEKGELCLVAVHPFTGTLLFGKLISRKNNFEWLPEDSYLISSLPEDSKLRRCTVGNGEKTFSSDFEFYSQDGRYFLRSIT